MADIGNQLEGVGEGLDRFLEALDDASYKLGSNAALVAAQARAAQKIKDQDLRFKKRLDKIEKANAKQIKDMQPFYKKLLTGIKAETKNRTLLTKGMKDLSKSMITFAKKALGGLSKGIMVMGKAGVLGGMVASVKLIADGLLRSDAYMAKLSKQTSMTRAELEGVRTAAQGAQALMNTLGVTMEETAATAGNLVEAFQSTDRVTKEIINSAQRLQLAYGMGAQEAANLTKSLTLANQEAGTFIDLVGSKAVAAGVSASLVMRDLASRTQQIAIHGERGNEAMINLAITAAKAGTSMKAFDGAEAAFSDIETITSNFGDLGARFGEQLTAAWGTPEQNFYDYFEGGKKWADNQERALDALSDQFDVTKDGLVQAGTGRRVEAGWVKKLAAARGIEVEAMVNMIATKDKERAAEEKALATMTKAEYKVWKKQQKDEKAAAAANAEREKKAIQSRMSMIKQLTSIWTGLYSTLTEQLSKIFGLEGDTSKSITALGDKIKAALNLKDLAKDVAAGGGGVKGFGNAIMMRLTPIFEKVKILLLKKLTEVFPVFAAEIAAGGGGMKAFTAAISSRVEDAIKMAIGKAFGIDKDEVDLKNLAKTAASTVGVMGAVGGVAKALSMIKGTWANPMVVTIAGGATGMGMGGGGRSTKDQLKNVGRGKPAGRIARASGAAVAGGKGLVAKLGKIFGKGGLFLAPLMKIFAPLTKLTGPLTKLTAPLTKVTKVLGKSGAFLAPLTKFFGSGKGFLGKIMGGISGLGKGGGIAKSLLKKVPFLGGGLAALEVIGAGMNRLNATSDEQKEIANKQLAKAGGSAVGLAIGTAVGTLGGPIGMAIGAVVGSWLGGKAGDIIADRMDGITDFFEDWVGTWKESWDNITSIASSMWTIAGDAFDIASARREGTEQLG